MAAIAQGHQVHPDGRTWKSHFPKGDLWVFGYGWVNSLFRSSIEPLNIKY